MHYALQCHRMRTSLVCESVGMIGAVEVENMGSNPFAVLAQLVERKALNLVVQGSSPWGGATCRPSLIFFTHGAMLML